MRMEINKISKIYLLCAEWINLRIWWDRIAIKPNKNELSGKNQHTNTFQALAITGDLICEISEGFSATDMSISLLLYRVTYSPLDDAEGLRSFWLIIPMTTMQSLVSGGCIADALLESAKGCFKAGFNALVIFGFTGFVGWTLDFGAPITSKIHFSCSATAEDL